VILVGEDDRVRIDEHSVEMRRDVRNLRLHDLHARRVHLCIQIERHGRLQCDDGHRTPHGSRAGRRCRSRCERGVLPEDRALELAQRIAGLQAELLEKRLARGAVGRECVGLTAGSVEREHELRMPSLPER
jgi:hypothetical protein